MEPTHTINGKRIYVVENHASALLSWAAVRRRLVSAPILLSLDHHADTCPAFTKAIHKDGRAPEDHHLQKISKEYCDKLLDFNNSEGLLSGIARLRHDEHVDAAVVSGIIDHAYVICFQDAWPAKRKTLPNIEEYKRCLDINPKCMPEECPFQPFDRPENSIFELYSECHPLCTTPHHTAATCKRKLYNAAIESDFLKAKLDVVGEMSKAMGIQNILDEPFILDIDLDYFHTAKSVRPKHHSIFYEMIRKSCAVTVATEPLCVQKEKLHNEKIDSQILLAAIMGHLNMALDG